MVLRISVQCMKVLHYLTWQRDWILLVEISPGISSRWVPASQKYPISPSLSVVVPLGFLFLLSFLHHYHYSFLSATAVTRICFQSFSWFWDCKTYQGKAVLCGIWHRTGTEAGTGNHSLSWTVHCEFSLCLHLILIIIKYIPLNSPLHF